MQYIIIDAIFIGIIILVNIIAFLLKPTKQKLVKNVNSNYAIIIPARDESRVINNTLNAIKRQNKDMTNTYVIVENKNDPTCKIVKNYGANVFVRKTKEQTKGNAIDECLKEILKNKHYDLYFIFDADNIINKNFIKNMLKYWKKGYQVASGYRNILNPKNVVSCSSGLLFCAQNIIYNKYRKLFNQPLTLSGSGFYIDGRIIEKLNGFPFYTLTEDFELSIYFEDNNISTVFAKDCIYYDEQPTNLVKSIKQRVRWLKGIFYNNKKRKKNLFINLSNISLILLAIFLALLAIEFILVFGILIGIIIIYTIMMLVTLFTLIFDCGKINMNILRKITCILFNPIFLLTYIICIIEVIIKKDIKWEKTEHKGVE